ncbi:MAG: quinol:cytochrome C oxidoreductase [Phycisphaerae bacterium]|nr:quinol:cytochrome C oxidoreductase [Phycisphaerae bacterium]
MALVAAGAVLSVATLLTGQGAVRFGFAWLWAFTFVWGIVLGSLCFVGMQHLTHSIWSVVVRRVAEMLASPMWLTGVLFLPVLLLGCLSNRFGLYPWLDRALVEQDHLLHAKRAYLNAPFFAVRAVVFFGLWMAFAAFFVRSSLRTDVGEGVERTLAMRKWSVPFMLIFAITATFAGVDWIMSLEPKWFSTIFGVYIFSGIFVAALAAITLLTLWLERSGRFGEGFLTRDHLYNLGALQFAFTCFWAYIAFSQYMLIWYGNMPEESFYLYDRLTGGWLGVSIALAVVRFVVPFLALLSRRAKMNRTMLWWVSIIVLAGQLLDLYWLIMPAADRAAPVLGWQEAGPLLLCCGLLLWCMGRFLKRHPPVAVGDPLLEQSRQFRL